MTLPPDTMMGLLSFAVLLLVLVNWRLADRLTAMEERFARMDPTSRDCDCDSCRLREKVQRWLDD